MLDALAALPMCTLASDGLLIHDTARSALAAHFMAIDPASHREARRAAWQALHTESLPASRSDLWRYTADLLYLVEAPSVREVFFPSGSEVVAVEAAKPADEAAVMAVAARHAGEQEVALLRRWWHALPESFRVTRDGQDDVSGYLCAASWSALPQALVAGEPLCSAWSRHLEDDPVHPGEEVLVLRSKLCADGGEALSPTDAALTMDLKRAYDDSHEGSVRIARERAARAGVVDRVRFEVANAVDYPGRDFDQVTIFDALHVMAAPRARGSWATGPRGASG